MPRYAILSIGIAWPNRNNLPTGLELDFTRQHNTPGYLSFHAHIPSVAASSYRAELRAALHVFHVKVACELELQWPITAGDRYIEVPLHIVVPRVALGGPVTLPFHLVHVWCLL